MRALRPASFGLLLVCLPLGIARAQTDVLARLHRMLPNEADPGVGAATASGDLDGDGDVDLVTAGYQYLASSVRRVFHNDGNGVFDEVVGAGVPSVKSTTLGMALADFNQDGFLDLVEANLDEPNGLFFNDQSGGLLDATGLLPSGTFSTLRVAVLDHDGDGDPDVLFANNGQQNSLFNNNGAGTFVDATVLLPVESDTTVALEVGDLDGDLDPDVLYGNYSGFLGQNRVLSNVGGAFVTAYFFSGPGDNTVQAAALVDVDLDNDLDAVLGLTGQDELYLNDGAGTLSLSPFALPAFGTGSELSVAIEPGDVDGDGDPDLLFGQAFACCGGGTVLLENLGGGAFGLAPAGALPELLIWTGVADLVDVDGDADLDFFRNSTELLLNDGAGTFVSTATFPEAEQTMDFAVGDVDSDGDPDVATASIPGSGLFLNDAGELIESPGAFGPLNGFQAVELGDVDQDGDLDAVFAPPSLKLGDGAGGFAATTAFAGAPFFLPKDLKLADVDGDGDPDAFFAANGSPDFLFLNTGGLFSDASFNLPASLTTHEEVAFGDVNADGALDLVLANRFAGNQLYTNQGAGVFADASGLLPADADQTTALALGDVEADGDVDVFFGNFGAQNKLYRNDGTGVFADATPALLPVDVDATQAAAFADLDLDGDLDLYQANVPDCPPPIPSVCVGGQDRLYANDGSGLFSDATGALPQEVDTSLALAVADLDGDSDPDVVLSGPAGLLFNLKRQVAWRGVPRIGKPLEMELFGDPIAVWFLATSTGRASVPLPPFGVLGIDPGSLLLQDAGVLDAAGSGSRAYAVPADPTLVGQSLFWQGLIGATPLFSNVERTTFTNL